MSTQGDEKLRLAFIGCGGHSSRTLQPNVHLVEEIELVAMCDLDEAKARQAAQRWGVGAWYTDYEKMIVQEAPDAVVIVGPPPMMQPIAKEVLGRGMHVFMEKPIAVTAALAKELVDASEASGAFGMMATHWRHAPAYAKAREQMGVEGFGAPSHCQGWFFAPGPTGPIWDVDDALKAYLLGQGVHLVDCTRSLMGDVAEVSAAAKSTKEAFDSCSVNLKFDNGATGTLSLVAHAPYWTGHRVFGNGGAFVDVQNARELRTAVPPFWTGQPRVDYENHPFQTWNYGPHSPGYGGAGYLQEFQHLAQSLRSHQQPVASMRDGYEALRVLEAIYESALTGNPVALTA